MRSIARAVVLAFFAAAVSIVFASFANTAAASTDCDSYTNTKSEESGMFTDDAGNVPAQSKNCDKPVEQKEKPPVKKPEPTKPPVKKPETPKPPVVTPRTPTTSSTPPVVRNTPPTTTTKRNATPPAKLKVNSSTVCFGEVRLNNTKGGSAIDVDVNGKSYKVAAGKTVTVKIKANKNGRWKAVVTAAGHHSVEKGMCGAKCPTIQLDTSKNAQPDAGVLAADTDCDGGIAWWKLLTGLAGAALLGGVIGRRTGNKTNEDDQEEVADEV